MKTIYTLAIAFSLVAGFYSNEVVDLIVKILG